MQKKQQQKTETKKPPKVKGNYSESFKKRAIFLGAIFIAVALGLGARLSYLQVVEAEVWRTKASENQLRSEVIAPVRGSIYDANMVELAQSSLVWKVSVDPGITRKSSLRDVSAAYDADPLRYAADELGRILAQDADALYELLTTSESRYITLVEFAEKPAMDEIRLLQTEHALRGLIVEENTMRRYPYGRLLSSVLGFTNSSSSGITGLEIFYNQQLSGVPGRLISLRDNAGNEIALGPEPIYHAPEDGQSLVLTVDINIQKALEESLMEAVAKHSVMQRGTGIVMDVTTGEILGMATLPSFDPNNPWVVVDGEEKARIEAIEDPALKAEALSDAQNLQWRNKAVSDPYEPGSVFKVITAAAGLDSGVFSLDSPFTCTGAHVVGDRTFGCALDKVHGTLSLHDALIESCNISFVQIGAGVGAATWYDYVNAFGFTKATGVDLPGEPNQATIDYLTFSLAQLTPTQLASVSFGQSNKYTALQMITAASAVVNGGKLVQPHIVREILNASGNTVKKIGTEVKRQVISAEASADICRTLEDLVASPNSYSRNAYVAGYHVGGKSGTAEKLEVRENEGRDAYISTFFAFAPADNPRIAVLIVLDEPTNDLGTGNFFGGRVAGPVAGTVIGTALKTLGVEPDYEDSELGRTTMACPNLVDMQLGDAYVVLNQSGLNYRVVGGGGAVVAQYPENFMQVPRGGQVILYTESTEQQMTEIPNLDGQNAQAAIDLLKGMGLNVLLTGAPESGANVVVTLQDIAAGTQVPMGTVVGLTLQDLSAATE